MILSVSADPQVRLAKPEDLDAIVAIEMAGWPSGHSMRAEKNKFSSRIEHGLIWVVCDPNATVWGMFTAFRPQWAQPERLDELLTNCPADAFDACADERWKRIAAHYDFPRDWHEATTDGTLDDGAMHDPKGGVLFGVGLAVHQQCKGRGLGRTLLRTVLTQAATTGARYFFGYGRLPGFHRFPDLDVDSYLKMTQRGPELLFPQDAQLRFYWSIGAQPARTADGRYRYVAIPESMREDPESRQHGVLIVAPMGGTVFPLERLKSSD